MHCARFRITCKYTTTKVRITGSSNWMDIVGSNELKFDKCLSTVGEPDRFLCMKNSGRRLDKVIELDYRRGGSVQITS